MPIPIFDGHNDLIARIHAYPEVDVFSGHRTNHLSEELMSRGGMTGGLFALFVPPADGRTPAHDDDPNTTADDAGNVAGPRKDAQGPHADGTDIHGAGVTHDAHHRAAAREGLAPRVSLSRARLITLRQFSILLRLVERSDGRMRICRTVREIETAQDAGAIAVVIHLEGADGIASTLEELDLLYAAGLRSLGPVWSRHNRFGHGVPIYGLVRPNTVDGLTGAGRNLIQRCNELGIMVDLSHMTEAGFWDVAEVTNAPLVATHSNAYDLCRSPRNLTNDQLRAVGESGGVVGLNFAVIFLRTDGAINTDTPVSVMVEHVRHMVAHAGIEHVALGSDFDGAPIPRAIGDAAGLPVFMNALRDAGFAHDEVEYIAWKNWRRVLRDTWGA